MRMILAEITQDRKPHQENSTPRSVPSALYPRRISAYVEPETLLCLLSNAVRYSILHYLLLFGVITMLNPAFMIANCIHTIDEQKLGSAL